jgi:hypothetical protein
VGFLYVLHGCLGRFSRQVLSKAELGYTARLPVIVCGRCFHLI